MRDIHSQLRGGSRGDIGGGVIPRWVNTVLSLNTEDVVGVAPTHGVCFVIIMHKYDNPSLAVFYPASQHLGGNHESWGTHGERKAWAYYGVWGQSPRLSPGAEPLVMDQRGKAP